MSSASSIMDISNFDRVKSEVQELIKVAFFNHNVETLEAKDNELTISELDRRVIVDQSLRDYLLCLIQDSSNNVDTFESYINFTIELSQRELCSPSTPVILLSDIFDMFTLDQCEELFTFVEAGVNIWKQDLFFGACKNNLLRMCNDLLRRLSRSQNTVFRGRILLFLAKFFPFSERSGLNIVSEFNLDNVTDYMDDNSTSLKESLETDDEVDAGSDPDKKIKIDYNLYSKFLILQDFCRSPNQCYNKVRWRVFVNSATDILTAFTNYKLDSENIELKSPRDLVIGSANQVFFAKYLTNPKLLELQLSDPNFRRSLLIQFLLIFQYLTSTVKFKLDSYELKTDQTDWIKEQTNSVYKLLSETPANSSKFAESIRHILTREELWNNWKNEGCPEFRIPASLEDDGEVTKVKAKPKRKNISELINEATQQGKYYMGHPELTRLWNLNPNNLEACKGKERDFLPGLDEYFEEAVMQLDPAAKVENEYKKVNDGNFGWRALRLLAQRSPYFFTHTNNPINKLPEYLELSLRKIARDRPQQVNGNDKVENMNEEDEEPDVLLKQEEKETQEENMEQEEIIQNVRNEQKIPYETLEMIAKSVAEQWRKLAVKLGYGSDEIQLLENEKDNDLERAESMLRVWADEDVDATPENLEYTLEGLGFLEAAKFLQNKTS